MNDMASPVSTKKQSNKLKGFNVRILDDGTYHMRTDNTNYDLSKEYSFKNTNELTKGMKEMIDMMNGSMKKDKTDNPPHPDILTMKAIKQ